MTSILVVCTGNICRSPIAEGLLRNALRDRYGEGAPVVTSAGTWGVEGASATTEATAAAAERGANIGEHRARRLSEVHADDADLVVTMAGEHRDAIADPVRSDRVFTLKELVRLLESLSPEVEAPSHDAFVHRVAQAAAARRAGFTGNPLDDDVADPLGLPMQSYRAIAWELDEWIARLVPGLFGAAPLPVASEG